MLNVKKAARKIADLHTFMINTQSLQKFLNVATFSTLFFQIFQNAPQITQFFVILSPAPTESTEASHRSHKSHGLFLKMSNPSDLSDRSDRSDLSEGSDRSDLSEGSEK